MTRPSGIGSWPGTDMRTTVRLVRDLLAEARDDPRGGIPYLPELPARGPGAEIVGRTAGALVDLPVDLQPSGWRMVDRSGRDAERTEAMWRRDLDDLAEAFDGYQGDLKVQLAGPWTMAASVRLGRGERLVVDPGACRDLRESLAEGVTRHLARVGRLVPGARLWLQIDEPMLPHVLAGSLPTSSGFGRIRAVDPAEAATGLRQVLAAAGDAPTIVHCCADVVPLPVIRQAGAGSVALDTGLLGASGWESVAATVEAGVGLWAGVVNTNLADGPPPSATDGQGRPPRAASGAAAHRELADRLLHSWRDVGLPAEGLNDVILTPSCGLAGLSPEQAVTAQRRAVDAAGALTAVLTT